MRPKYPEVFSDRLIELRKEKEYWKLMTKKKVAISHQGLKLRWADHQPAFTEMSMEQRKKMLKKVDEKVQQHYSRRYKAREIFLQEQAEHIREGKQEKQNEVKIILKR